MDLDDAHRIFSRKNRSPKTVELYLNQLKQIIPRKYHSNFYTYLSNNFLSLAMSIFNDNKRSYSSRITRLSILLILDEAEFIVHKEVHDEVIKYFDTLKQLNRASQIKKQNEVVMPFSKIKSKILARYGPDSEQYLFVMFFESFPVRDDLHDTIVVDEFDYERNEYNIKTNELYLKDYKTASLYGPKTFKGKPELPPFLKEYHDLPINKKIFKVKHGSSFVKTMLANIGIDKKGQSINYLRHSIASFDSELNEEEIVKLSDKMTHKVTTHGLYKKQS